MNPKTGKPINTGSNFYGRRHSLSARIAIKHAIRKNGKVVNRKPCYIIHKLTGQVITSTSVMDCCRFIGIDPASSSKRAMVRSGVHKEWAFFYGEYFGNSINSETLTS